MNPLLTKVLDRVNLVVFQTRIVTPIRDTGEGKKAGARIEKVLQACFDPTALRPLTRQKQVANRMCRAYGTKVETLGAWAVPQERTPELLGHLSAIATEWNGLANELAKSMEQRVESWIAQNPSEASSIRALAPSAANVREATRFIYTSFRLRTEDVEDNGCLESDLGGLAEQTLHELAVALRDASLEKSSGDQYTQGVKEVLGRLAVKAESLAFLDQRIAEVASVLTSTLAMLPASGMIAGAHAVLVKSLVDQMLNPRKLMRSGFAKIERPGSVEVPATRAPQKPVKVVPPIDRELVGQALLAQQGSPVMPSQAFQW